MVQLGQMRRTAQALGRVHIQGPRHLPRRLAPNRRTALCIPGRRRDPCRGRQVPLGHPAPFGQGLHSLREQHDAVAAVHTAVGRPSLRRRLVALGRLASSVLGRQRYCGAPLRSRPPTRTGSTTGPRASVGTYFGVVSVRQACWPEPVPKIGPPTRSPIRFCCGGPARVCRRPRLFCARTVGQGDLATAPPAQHPTPSL